MYSSSRNKSGSSSNKRALVVEPEVEPIRKTARRTVLDVEVATLQAELEHAQSLRQLDAKRFQKELERVQKQLEFSVEESSEAKALMEEVREESELYAQQQREARLQAQRELREVQEQLDQALVEHHMVDEEEEDSSVLVLQEQLTAKANENEQLQTLIQDLRQQQLQGQKESQNKPLEEETLATISKSPPEVLRELNRVRIQLAETERKNRQLQRLADLGKKHKIQLLQEQEATRSAKARVQQVEAQLMQLTQQSDTRGAKLTAWKQFGSLIYKLLGESSSQVDMPPEEHKVQRFLTNSQMGAQLLEQEKYSLEQELESSQKTAQDSEHRVKELERSKDSMQKLLEEEQHQTELYKRQVNILKGQERVWKRELESLRSIVETFDALPLDGTSKPPATSTDNNNSRTLQVQLTFGKEELQVLKDGQESMKQELEKVLLERKDLQATHNTVLEKFGKLKDALYAQRQKAETAEQRANRAEELAGKGSFNPHTTRVLHLQHNPLTEALKQEVAVLKRQLQTKEKPVAIVNSDVDPNKLHQRLKESFKEQIGRFREGVYLMTGFKIDMLPGTDDRPKFKVRSVFAEQEEDHLMFQWPPGKNVSSLDLLGTELAKSLTTTPSYEYISRFHSLPTFLASVQLSLFEKQTMM
jgi:chromosome segregation ATPase